MTLSSSEVSTCSLKSLPMTSGLFARKCLGKVWLYNLNLHIENKILTNFCCFLLELNPSNQFSTFRELSDVSLNPSAQFLFGQNTSGLGEL